MAYPDIYFYNFSGSMYRIPSESVFSRFESFDIKGDRAVVCTDEGDVYHVMLMDGKWLIHNDVEYGCKIRMDMRFIVRVLSIVYIRCLVMMRFGYI